MQTTRIRFVDNVVVQVIERQLVSKMTDIFSASRTSKMADDGVKLMTKGSEAKKARLIELDRMLETLGSAAKACRDYAWNGLGGIIFILISCAGRACC
jgi:hypothetical protein